MCNNPNTITAVAVSAAKPSEWAMSACPAASAGAELPPGLRAARQLPERNPQRKHRQKHRRRSARPAPARAQLPPQRRRRRRVRAPRPRRLAPAETEHQQQRRRDQRPAQRQRRSVIEGRVKPHPDFRRENLHLQNRRDGEIIQRQHQRQNRPLQQARSRQRQQQPAQQRRAAQHRVRLQLGGLRAPPRPRHQEKRHRPCQQYQHPNRPAQRINVPRQPGPPEAVFAEQFDPAIDHQERRQRQRRHRRREKAPAAIAPPAPPATAPPKTRPPPRQPSPRRSPAGCSTPASSSCLVSPYSSPHTVLRW